MYLSKEKTAFRLPSESGTRYSAATGRLYTAKRLYHARKAKVKVILLIILTMLTIYSIFLKSNATVPALTITEHKVKQGECLWSIAQIYKPKCVSMDKYMEWVYQDNETSKIYPGDTVIMRSAVT